MTKEQATELLPIIKAYSEGKTIQFNYPHSKWQDLSGELDFNNCDASYYRIKPEPALIPFTLETFPLNAWVRLKGVSGSKTFIHSISDTKVCYGRESSVTYYYLFENFEYSLDGKTWLPCGIAQNS
jgi:hypothetical protein